MTTTPTQDTTFLAALKTWLGQVVSSTSSTSAQDTTFLTAFKTWVRQDVPAPTPTPVTIFKPVTALNFDNSDGSTENRSIFKLTAASQGFIQIQFAPNKDVGSPVTDFTRMSVGKWDGKANAANTTATPIEVTFNGGNHGLIVSSSSAPLWSDWVNVKSLTLNVGDSLVVIIENGPNGGYYSSQASNVTTYLGPLGSWNAAAPTGFTSPGNYSCGIAAIQTISTAIVPAPQPNPVPVPTPGPTATINQDWANWNFTSAQANPSSSWWMWLSPWGGTGAAHTWEVVANDTTTFPNNVTMQWTWPTNTPGATYYGALALGFNYYPIGTGTGSEGLLPATLLPAKQINSITSIVVSHNVTISGTTDGYDLIYDAYLTANPYDYTGLVEIEVSLHLPIFYSDWLKGLTTKYPYTDKYGTNWWIILNPNASPAPKMIIFCRQDYGEQLVLTFDLKELLAQAVMHGLLTGSEYFDGFVLCPEVTDGSGAVTVNSISVSYQ